MHKDLLYVYNTYLSTEQALNILDLGCGHGRNPLYLAAAGYYVTGIDVDKASIDSVNNLAKRNSKWRRILYKSKQYSINQICEMVGCLRALFIDMYNNNEPWYSV